MIQPIALSSPSLTSLLPSAPAPTGGAADFALSLATVVEGAAVSGQPIAAPGNSLPPASDTLPIRIDPLAVQVLAPVSAAVIVDTPSAGLTEVILATPLEDTPVVNAPPAPVLSVLVTRAPVAPRPVVSRRAPDAAETLISNDPDGETNPDESAQAELESGPATIAELPALPVTAAVSLDALAIALSTPVPTLPRTAVTSAAAAPEMALPDRTTADLASETPPGPSVSVANPPPAGPEAPAPASTSVPVADTTAAPDQIDRPRAAATEAKDAPVQPTRSPRLAPASASRPSRKTSELPVEPGQAADPVKAASAPISPTVMPIADVPSPVSPPSAPEIARPRHDGVAPATVVDGVEPMPAATPAQPVTLSDTTQAMPAADRQPVSPSQPPGDVSPIAARSDLHVSEQVPARDVQPIVPPLPATAMPVVARHDDLPVPSAPVASARPQYAPPVAPPPAAGVDKPVASVYPAVTAPGIATADIARTAAPLDRAAPAPGRMQTTRSDAVTPPPTQPATVAAPGSAPWPETVAPPIVTATADARQPVVRATAVLPPNQVALPASEAPALVAGATAPAFRLFAAAIHAARTDEPEQATPSAPMAVAAVDQVRAPAAVADARGAPLDMTSHRWPEAMVERIERLQETASAARDAASTSIRLAPDALGTIDVSVRTEGDTVHVHFKAEQAATRTLLADAQPRLADLAEAKGLKLTQGNIGGGTDGGGQRQPTPQPTPARPVAATPARAMRDDEPDTLTTRIA